METFNFPYHKYSVEYPESGFRMELGNSYTYNAAPSAPDQRIFKLHFDTMILFEAGYAKQSWKPLNPVAGDVWIDTGSVNKFLYSQQLESWYSALLQSSVVSNQSAAPDSTLTADHIVDDWSTSNHAADRYNAYGSAGWKVMSCYMKAVRRNGFLAMYSTGNNHAAWFDLYNGVATSLTVGSTCGMDSVGGGWYRVWLRANITNTASPIQRVGTTTPTGFTNYKGWGRNLRTNSVLYSQQFDNAAWTKVSSGGGSVPVVTANYATDPSGGSTADRVQFARTTTAGNDNSLLIQYGIGASQSARSIWMKSTSGATQYVLIYNSVGTYYEVAVTSAWRRFVIAASVDEFRFGLHRTYGTVQPLTADVLVWQAQNEVGAPTAGDTILTTGTTASVTDYIYKTNLLPYCNSFENWALLSGATLSSGHASPSFGTDARKLMTNSASGAHYVGVSTSGLTEGTYTLSVSVKAGELGWVRLDLVDSGMFAYFNCSTGAVGITVGGVTTSVVADANGFWRVSVTGTVSQYLPSPRIYLATSNGGASFTGTAGQGVYLYGAQLQSGIAATPLITTNGAAATETDAPGLAVWGLQLEDEGMGTYIPTTTSSVSTVGQNKPYRYNGTTWVSSTNSSKLNLLKNPELNAGLLEDFYLTHKLWKKFIYPHPLYGDVAVRFNKPLMLPKGNHGGNGTLEPFDIEFIEVPGGL